MIKYFIIINNKIIMVIKITTLLTTENVYTRHNHSVPLLGKRPAIPLNRQIIYFLFTHKTVITSTVFHFQFPKDRNFLCKWKWTYLKLHCQDLQGPENFNIFFCISKFLAENSVERWKINSYWILLWEVIYSHKDYILFKIPLFLKRVCL